MNLSEKDPCQMLLVDSQDIQAVCEYFGIPTIDITGAMVDIEDGEYVNVLMTSSSRPYSVDADYKPVQYWLDFYKEEDNKIDYDKMLEDC